MAIKGKSRSRGARTVARGPKPVYVPVRRRLVQRRGFWLVVASVLGLAIVGGLVYGFLRQRDEDRAAAERRDMATAVREYAGQLESVLAQVGQPAPPTSFQAFADLTSTLAGLESGEVEPEAATATADGIVETAASSAETVAAIDVAAIVRDRGLDPAFTLHLFDSRDEIASGLRLYEQAAQLAALAATGAEDTRADLLARARDVAGLAAEVFARGYDAYVEAQSRAGTFQPTFPGGTFPGGTFTGPTGVTP